MKTAFMNLKKKLKEAFNSEDAASVEGMEEEYVQLDTSAPEEKRSKLIIRPYTINDFTDIKGVLDALRDGNTVGLVNIKPLKEKDLVELKRAINKLKKTCEAIEGDIAGFGDDWIVVVGSFGNIYRSPSKAPVAGEASKQDDFMNVDLE